MSDGMKWICSKDCEGLLAMEKGRLIREILEDLEWFFDLSTKKCPTPAYLQSKLKEKINKYEKRLIT